MDAYQAEIELIRSIVGKRFSIYEVRVRPEMVSLYVRVDRSTLDTQFDHLRHEMMEKKYIPLIVKEDGEYVIHVQKRRDMKYKSVKVNAILLCVTIMTTIIAGMYNWAGYEGTEFFSMRTLLFGTIFFAFPLMSILSVHELGHYFTARKHKVHASLPFFIPSVPPLGTFGAFISMRDPIPDRKSLLDIGISGPICGLLVAIPVAIAGIYLTSVSATPVPENIGDVPAVVYGVPLLYQFLLLFMPMPGEFLLHPTAFAGWVGLFVTALNLLPAGQLDGGHIARAALGDRAKYVSYGAIMFMFFLGMFYFGWAIIAVLILMLGARHPPPLNDITGLDMPRKWAGVAAAVILLLCFVPIPATNIEPVRDFEFTSYEDPSKVITGQDIYLDIPAGSFDVFVFVVNNTGNTFANITLKLGSATENLRNSGWMIYFLSSGTGLDNVTLLLNSSESQTVSIYIEPPPSLTRPGPHAIDIDGVMVNGPTKFLTVRVRIQ